MIGIDWDDSIWNYLYKAMAIHNQNIMIIVSVHIYVTGCEVCELFYTLP